MSNNLCNLVSTNAKLSSQIPWHKAEFGHIGTNWVKVALARKVIVHYESIIWKNLNNCSDKDLLFCLETKRVQKSSAMLSSRQSNVNSAGRIFFSSYRLFGEQGLYKKPAFWNRWRIEWLYKYKPTMLSSNVCKNPHHLSGIYIILVWIVDGDIP